MFETPPPGYDSWAGYFASLPGDERQTRLAKLSPDDLARLPWDWWFWGRQSQQAPTCAWGTWLILAGRGWGKTRTGVEWVKTAVESGQCRRVALVGQTAAAVRDVMVEGESGILAKARPSFKPLYEPSKRRLTWPNGAMATTFSADKPDMLRGPQFDGYWADELAAWRYPEAWSNLMLGVRLGTLSRGVVTTTPKPVRLVRDLLVADRRWPKGDVVLTRGTTYENIKNLSPQFKTQIIAQYEGTHLGRQELNAELLTEAPGALWKRARIEELRVTVAPELERLVVAIDPAATSGDDADETGIVVAGVAEDGQGYVLEDLSHRASPDGWARAAVTAYWQRKADRIVAEVNNGGEMVEHVIRTVDPNVSFRAVHASRGKIARAEPVAALYEQGRVHHVGSHPDMEDQMCSFAGGGDSPDRMDALVWALTDLMIDRAGEMRLLGGPEPDDPTQRPSWVW